MFHMLSACTIIARNYLPYAWVLTDSFFANHPDGTFTVLIIDDEARRFVPQDSRIDWRRLSDLGFEPAEIHRLAGIYDVTELATAVKPRLLRCLLEEGKESVVYLDPDIRIFESLDELGSLATRHGIVLTPHTLHPFPRDGRNVDGLFVLAAGAYNLGFIGVGQEAMPFLEWWWQSTRREALNDVATMMFTDQRWVDFVPSFFEHHILKDSTYNVAYWNLHARDVTWDGERYLVDGAPMRFFHFSGFDVGKPWLLSRHQGERPRILLSERPALGRLCREYAAALAEADLRSAGRESYGWSTTAAGLPLSKRIRRMYWEALTSSETGQTPEPPDPFDTLNPGHFTDWLNSPQPGGPLRISRFLNSIHKERVDLQSHFPDLDGRDELRFTEWILGDGVKQTDIASELLPQRRSTSANVPDLAPTTKLTEGVNAVGYFRAELGIGEAARLLINALEAQGVPYSTTTYGKTVSRQDHVFHDRPPNGSAYDINVLCVNADCTRQFAHDIGRAFFAGRHTVGYWFWEVDRFPDVMHAAFDVVDEVWAASDFVASAIRASRRKPVFVVPLPVVVPRASRTITREQLGLDGRFMFLQIFDFMSVMERKNPLGLIEAFSRAFSPNEGPTLVLKTINGERSLTERERLRAAAENRSDILIIDSYYSAEEKNALLGSCDCYVSLHRSEGLGLTIAEAMALGKPVIATGYSGNLQFMTPENSYLVNYGMSGVPTGCGPYPQTASWAEPDLDEAARFMREVYERPSYARTRAERGQLDVLQRHNPRTSGAAIAARLDIIRSARRGRTTVPSPSAPEAAAPVASATLPALEAGLPHLEQLAHPTLSADGRPFRTFRLAAQRALFRVLRPYWFQQGRFHTELLTTVRQVAASLREGQNHVEALDGKVREFIGELHSAKSDVGVVADRLALSAAEQLELKDRQGRNERRIQDVETSMSRFPPLVRTMREETTRVEGLAAGLATKAAQVEARMGSLQAASEIFQTNATAHLEQLASAIENVEKSASASETFQTNAAAHLGQLTSAVQNVEKSASASETFQTHAASHLKQLTGAVQHVEASVSASEAFQAHAAVHLAQLTSANQTVESSVAALSSKLFIRPYMAEPDRFHETDASGRQRLGYRSSNGAIGGPFYLGFEEIFRGPEAFIRDRQRVYLPLLKARSEVVDIGCGRGEMLDLLRDMRVCAVGVDSDPDMVQRCRLKGHRVEHTDALMFLRGQPAGSIGAIFSAQVIEHFSFEVLKEFLALCRSRLRKGGLFIAETPNPHALEAFKTFHTDPSHQHPIFPEVGLALCQLSGFEEAYVMFPQGSGDLDSDRQSQGEYAVVATAGATDQDIPSD